MIGSRFNFEDVFFRDLTVCVLDTLEGQIKWVNRFSSGDVAVQVPIYYSLTGDERFLLDSFSDDIVSNNRFIELNTDQIPRGHLTMTGFNIKSDEFANPNVWLRMVVENESEIRKILARVRAIPVTVNYDLTILLDSEIDTFKCAQAIMDTLWIYKFMYFEHNFMNIDAMILMPDTNQIEMSREKNLTSDNKIQLKASFEVSTYYPAFRRDRVSAPGYSTPTGTGMTDPNWYASPFTTDGTGDSVDTQQPFGPSERPPFGTWPFDRGNPRIPPYPINRTPGGYWPDATDGATYSVDNGNGEVNIYQGGPYGQTSSWYPTTSTGDVFGRSAARRINTNDQGGSISSDPDYYQIAPKRTRWFNNILRAREKSATPITNPNGQAPPSVNPNANPPTDPNA